MAPYRAFWLLALLGLSAQLTGLLVDVVLHARDSTLAAREEPLTLTNPGHALIAAGLALTAFALTGGAAHWLSRRLRFARMWGLAFAFGIACAAAAVRMGSAWLSEALSSGHEHPALAASAESGASGHTHGEEIPVTASQLRAAAELVERVVTATKKYEDVRAALADGYVQITQDLPASQPTSTTPSTRAMAASSTRSGPSPSSTRSGSTAPGGWWASCSRASR